MKGKAMNEWNWDDNYQHAWSETDDPRVFAVITRDDDLQATDLLDVCELDPVILGYAHGYRADLTIANHPHGADACAEMYNSAEHFVRAFKHFGDGDRLERWARLYLGRVPVFVSSLVDRYSWAVVLLTPEDAEKHTRGSEDATVAEVRAVLDGEVFGAGAAVLPDRVAPREVEASEVIDAAEMECWGYVGEEYAKGEALEFAHRAAQQLPEFLPLD